MRQVIKNVYRYDELSDKAKEKARQDYAAMFGYSFSDEAIKSLAALAEHFDGKLADYSIDYFSATYSSAKFSMPDEMERAEIESRLSALGDYDPNTLRGHGDCKLTGYCADEDAIDGFRSCFYRMGESSLDKLMQAAFDRWLRAAQADCNSFYSDEDGAFSEHCEANDYEFWEDGSFCSEK